MNGPTVLALVHPEMMAGCTAWRVSWPMQELLRRGYKCGYGPVGDPGTAAAIEHADAVIAARLEWAAGDERKGLAWADLLHEHGKALIYETDDDLYGPGSPGRVRETTASDGKTDDQLERDRQARIFALVLADGVTVSTEALARVVRPLTDSPVRVVPNAIDLPRFRSAMAPRDPRAPLTIGWAGGNRPDRDATDLADAWRRIAGRYGDRVRFVVGGYPLGALVRSVPEDRLLVVPKRSIDAYPATIGLFDIGCCPLADEPFNWAKSPIKALELGAARTAVVASPTVYGDLIDDNADGLLCDSAEEWDWAISTLIEDADRRRQLARALTRKVERDHSLAATVHRWPAAWADLLADFRIRALRDTAAAHATSPVGGGPHG